MKRARHPGRLVRHAVAASVLGCSVATDVAAQQPWRTLDEFLATGVRLPAAQLAALDRGDVIVRLLPTADRLNVALLGAVRVGVPASFFVERQRDLPNALRAPRRVAVHLFGDSTTVDDVQEVELSSGDLKELRDCRAGSCNFKLPLPAMEQLRSTSEGSGPGAAAAASAYLRQWIVDYVSEYRRRGNAAMVVYDDEGNGGPGVRSSDALDWLLRDSVHVTDVPSLAPWLLDYPSASPSGAQEAFFWSRDEFPHLRRVLRVMHEIIYTPASAPDMTVVAAKQIYADHYFEAGVELLAVADHLDDAGAGAAPRGVTVVALRCYRFDHLPSRGLFNIRGRAMNGLRDNLQADLRRLKRESESAWVQRRGG